MITNELSLNGTWELFYYDDGTKNVNNPSDLIGIDCVPAQVPGNVEISLAEAGVISKDLFKGMTTHENEKFETYHWWYKKEFEFKKQESGRHTLCFDAVDCFAEYYLNGIKLGISDNAFIPAEFDVTDKVNDGMNTLYVHIGPSVFYPLEQECTQFHCLTSTRPQSFVRKPAHSFGWDIFPRAVSAGIWRDVSITTDDRYNVEQFGYRVINANKDYATLYFYTVIDMPLREYKKDVQVNITATCEDHKFTGLLRMNNYKTASGGLVVTNPKLWWPYGYGEANIYKLEYELTVDGEVKDYGSMNMGIRSVELKRTDSMLEKDHCFKFVINGTDIMCKGSNWVPLDAYHSRDKERYQKALELFTDTHCNILRVWGGGVYEAQEFYDYCDRHGIMVWQDFMMACNITSPDEKTVNNIKKEAEYVIKSLRHHPSIILWSGDNEIDACIAGRYVNPDLNKINREVLPEIINMHDLSRPYLASSPFMSGKNFMDKNKDIFPEVHLWGPRDYYKSDFYKGSKAHFVSETGYHGCPSRSTVEKTVTEKCVWPIYNEEWSLHSSDQRGSMHRVELMAKQIKQLFGFEPDNLDDFILASQISQAEAKKFFIERIRIKKPYTSGVIWWNMLDGWPQMSDAVVDYFFEKKLAYYYIKRSQEPFALMIDELANWNYTLVASNDTLETKSGTYKVYDIDDGNVLANGSFSVNPNANKAVAKIPLFYSEHKFLVIEWEIDGKKYYNHYLCGMPGFNFDDYKRWLNKYKELL